MELLRKMEMKTSKDMRISKLRKKIIKRFPSCFVDKLRPNDRINCKPIKLEIDERKAEVLRPVSHIKPFDVPFHLRESFQQEICDMLNAGVIEKCEVQNGTPRPSQCPRRMGRVAGWLVTGPVSTWSRN